MEKTTLTAAITAALALKAVRKLKLIVILMVRQKSAWYYN
jgi:hypothetical protein